jgi:hypothetical protein
MSHRDAVTLPNGLEWRHGLFFPKRKACPNLASQIPKVQFPHIYNTILMTQAHKEPSHKGVQLVSSGNIVLSSQKGRHVQIRYPKLPEFNYPTSTPQSFSIPTTIGSNHGSI